jgi:hypothetical protein
MVNLDNQVKKLNDLWEKNLTSTSSIKNAVDQVFIDINVAEQRANEVDNHLQRLKMDLKNYYNSAFFKEDSRLIREMHNTLCGDAAGRAGTTPPPENFTHQFRRQSSQCIPRSIYSQQAIALNSNRGGALGLA